MSVNMVTLLSLGNGAASELFKKALDKTMENIMDVNTSAVEPREITIKIRLKPSERRTYVATEIIATTKLAGDKGFKSEMFIEKMQGKYQALQRDPDEVPLPLGDDEKSDDDKTIKFKKEQAV